MSKKLFTPLKINQCEIPNRFVVTAMVTNYCNEDGTATDRYIRYHEEKAKGGWGLILTEDYAVNQHAKGYKCIPGLWNDGQIEGHKRLTETIHKYESKIFAQIYHPGRQSSHGVNGGVQPIAPSAIPCPWCRDLPREITVDEIKQIVKDFADCAYRVKQSGFDGVEIHLAHGYLLFEFLSPFTNKRTDEYGGSFENRVRIVKEVYEAVREKVGDDFPVTARISSIDGFIGGRGIVDSLVLAQWLEETGFNALNVSQGMYGDNSDYNVDPQKEHAFNHQRTEEIKKVVDFPVIITNNMYDPRIGEAILKAGKADFIGMGRSSLADPHLPEKAKAGDYESIRHCLYCNLGCYGGILSGGCVSCVVNPSVGREGECDYSKVMTPKKVYIAGGGPGGMEAARVAAIRGHHVTLFEKQDQLGGQFRSAAYPPTKGDLSTFVSWLNMELKKHNVEIRYNTELTKEIVQQDKPDTVIVATGGVPAVPPIKGIERPHVYFAEDVLLGKVAIGEEIVIAGGGEVGSETASLLAVEQKGSITIVEMLPDLMNDIAGTPKIRIKKILDDYNVKSYTNSKVVEIGEGHVVIERGVERFAVKADTVVLALGYKPNNKLAEELKDVCADIKVIGGATETGNALGATRDGFDVGMSI